jgi:Flp pilus assembly protein TadG
MPPTLKDDRGSTSLFFLIVFLTLAALIGLAVDYSGMITARQHTFAVAAEAARAGGQQIDDATAMGGTDIAVNTTAAAAAASTYLAAAGVSGTATITTGGTALEVDAHTTYSPRFLGAIGIGPIPIDGHAETRLVQVIQGAER